MNMRLARTFGITALDQMMLGGLLDDICMQFVNKTFPFAPVINHNRNHSVGASKIHRNSCHPITNKKHPLWYLHGMVVWSRAEQATIGYRFPGGGNQSRGQGQSTAPFAAHRGYDFLQASHTFHDFVRSRAPDPGKSLTSVEGSCCCCC